MVDTTRKALIIDNGSGTFKLGFGGETTPAFVFPSIVGTPNQKGIDDGLDMDDRYIGHDASVKKGLLSIHYPISHGVIQNWDEMELIWEYSFSKLKVNPTDQPTLLTEPPLNPNRNRERSTQIMFETFHVPSLYIGCQPVLTLYSFGRTTGFVVDSGDGVTHAVPIYGGYIISHSCMRSDIGGSNLTDFMVRILTERGNFLWTSAEKELVKDIKEKLCYCSLDYEGDMAKSEDEEDNNVKNYETEDGRTISLGNERFRVPETLFDPTLLGSEYLGVHQLVYKSIMSSDLDLRTDLWKNIVLGGGNALFPNFSNRLQKELFRIAPGTTQIRVYPPENPYSVWCGGSIMSSLPAFNDCWISSDEYDEVGPLIVSRKCF